MSGYIMLWKILRTKPKFGRLVKRVKAFWDETDGPPLSLAEAESRALGYLAKLWLVADSHIRQDDTLDMSADEVDELLGTQGLCKVLGSDWLEVLDPPNQVRLPEYLDHNGSQARKTAHAASRQEKHRQRQRVESVTPERDSGNAGRDGADASPSPPIPSHPIPTQPLGPPPTPSADAEGVQTVDTRPRTRAERKAAIGAMTAAVLDPKRFR